MSHSAGSLIHASYRFMTLKRSTGNIPSRSGTSGMPSPGGDGRGQWRLHEVVVDFWCCHAMSYAIRDGTKLCSIYGRYEGLERNGERESKRRIKQNKTPDHSRTQPTEERKSGAGNQKVGWHVAGAGATGSDKRKGVGERNVGVNVSRHSPQLSHTGAEHR